MTKISDKDQALIRLIQDDLPHDRTPFLSLACKLGWTEEEVLNRIRLWMDQGIIKRFGALVRHHNLGFQGNAMVAWYVPSSDLDRIGTRMADYPFISHCYERPVRSDWPYNLYTMFHAKDRDQLESLVKKVSEETGAKKYRILYTVKEWKKKSMRYI
jgi:DNA-binding Lrp family transcriptional regulator